MPMEHIRALLAPDDMAEHIQVTAADSSFELCDITCAVAHERHTVARDVRQHDLALFAVGQRSSGIRVDYLYDVVYLVIVIPAAYIAVHGESPAGLGEPIVRRNAALPCLGKIIYHALRDIRHGDEDALHAEL